MPSLMADHDVEGQFNLLLRLLMSDDWRDFWLHLGYDIDSFESLEIATDIADVDLWRLCQERDIILITGNRNKEGPESLEATIEQFVTPESLPVLTIGEPNRIFNSREYAHRVAERLLEYLGRDGKFARYGPLVFAVRAVRERPGAPGAPCGQVKPAHMGYLPSSAQDASRHREQSHGCRRTIPNVAVCLSDWRSRPRLPSEGQA